MRQWQYKVTFLTPAFLGDAQQNGRWRTPPFKALLRQWWRVVWAADHNFPRSLDAMRVEEGQLFGNAWLVNNFRKSLVRLRLDRWSSGSLDGQKWGLREASPPQKVRHPEVNQPIGPLLYLGYGPLLTKKATQGWATVLKNLFAVASGEAATLTLGIPESHPNSEPSRITGGQNDECLRRALSLIHLFGTIGGRSRNGWGSLELTPLEGTPELDSTSLPLQDWRQALTVDWPHAIGKDEKGPLIWRTRQSYSGWEEVLKELAVIKIALRTQFGFPTTPPPHANVQERHLLSYPITRHTARAWGNTWRLPNSLRFKVRRDPANSEKLIGVIYHIPCCPPPAFRADGQQLQSVWQRVHALLDELCKPAAQRNYGSIANSSWKNAMPNQLRGVQLERLPR